MVLDEILEKLFETGGVIRCGELKIPALVYADDLLLLAHGPRNQQLLADKSAEFFQKRGLSINPAKCRSLTVKVLPAKRKLYCATSYLEIGGVPIPGVTAEGSFKYLGFHFSHQGITDSTDPP